MKGRACVWGIRDRKSGFSEKVRAREGYVCWLERDLRGKWKNGKKYRQGWYEWGWLLGMKGFCWCKWSRYWKKWTREEYYVGRVDVNELIVLGRTRTWFFRWSECSIRWWGDIWHKWRVWSARSECVGKSVCWLGIDTLSSEWFTSIHWKKWRMVSVVFHLYFEIENNRS